MKNIWIFNHYATPPSVSAGTRHFNFAKHLIALGYQVNIFAASSLHNSDINLITDSSEYINVKEQGVNFILLRAKNYVGNGFKRIFNMYQYYHRLMTLYPKFTPALGKPDIIIGSSVHPLACIAATLISRKIGCKNIVEIRDLWPETFVGLGILTPKNPVLKLLYRGERWIYENADQIIFTMEGGSQYIAERKWDTDSGGIIDKAKIQHINNGVDTAWFEHVQKNCILTDEKLESKAFKVVYTGSIGKANHIELLIDVAKYIWTQSPNNIVFIIYGDGSERQALDARVAAESLGNIVFRGYVDKNYIPNILSRGDLNIYFLHDSPLYRFGLSLNKSFEYFASGKPTIQCGYSGYSLIEKYQCGQVVKELSVPKVSEAILKFASMPSAEYQQYCTNAKLAAQNYDFKELTKKLVTLIEQ